MRAYCAILNIILPRRKLQIEVGLLRILISNDDGISAAGIHALAKAFCQDNEVFVCAPDIERSACSHSVSMLTPLRIKKYDMGLPVEAYSCNGTPADCVMFALNELLRDKPDLVISGINAGGNLGQDVLYSGTVSAAFEGAVHGVKAIAISLAMHDKTANYDPAAQFLYNFIENNGFDFLENGTVLNINVPSKILHTGYKLCRLGQDQYNLRYEKRQDTAGREYYWIDVKYSQESKRDIDADVHYIKQGYVTLTPLRYNLTDESLLNKLKERV